MAFTNHQEIFERHQEELKRLLERDGEKLLECLGWRDVLDPGERDTAKRHRGAALVGYLVDVMKTKGQRGFEIFIECLDLMEKEYAARLMREAATDVKGEVTTACERSATINDAVGAGYVLQLVDLLANDATTLCNDMYQRGTITREEFDELCKVEDPRVAMAGLLGVLSQKKDEAMEDFMEVLVMREKTFAVELMHEAADRMEDADNKPAGEATATVVTCKEHMDKVRDQLVNILHMDCDTLMDDMARRSVLTPEDIVGLNMLANSKEKLQEMLQDIADKGDYAYEMLVEVLDLREKAFAANLLRPALEKSKRVEKPTSNQIPQLQKTEASPVNKAAPRQQPAILMAWKEGVNKEDDDYIDIVSASCNLPEVAPRRLPVDAINQLRPSTPPPVQEVSAQMQPADPPEAEEHTVVMKVNIEDRKHSDIFLNLEVDPGISFKALKEKVAEEWRFPVEVQRWLVNNMRVYDGERLADYHVDDQDTFVCLYLLSARSVGLTRKRTHQQRHGTPVLHQQQQQKEEARSEKQPPVEQRGSPGILRRRTGPLPERARNKVERTRSTVGWKCPTCTLRNYPTRPGCEMCGADRPKTYLMPNDYMMSFTEVKRLEGERHAEEQVRQELEREKVAARDEAARNYTVVQEALEHDVNFTTEEMVCAICFCYIPARGGIILRDCLHQFCKDCIADAIKHCEEPMVKCPYNDDYSCKATLTEHEIHALVSPEVYQKHLDCSLKVAEGQEPNSYHCKTPDCKGWCIYEDNVNFYKCDICGKKNCLTCNVIHEGMDCQTYQAELKRNAENDMQAKATQDMLEKLVTDGKAMRCPGCKIILQKKVGCDWMMCSVCKTELCWATRGPRWGPKGKGDTSGGCRCGVNGKSCHPKCQYCH